MPRVRRSETLWLATVLLAAAALLATITSSAGALSREQRASKIGAQAYVYGTAPLDLQRVIVRFPPNHLISVTQPATPAERLVVLPNVDTLYTVAHLDLARGPLVVHVPEEHGRYYTLQLMDAYTNVFGYIGRRVTGTHAGNFAIVGPGWHGRVPRGIKRIQSPTPTVFMLGRTLLRGPADLANADAIQRRYTLTPLSGLGGAPLPAIFVPSSSLMPAPVARGLAFYDAIDGLMQHNPPPRSQRALLRRFASVGIGPGRSPSTESLDPATRRGLLAGLIAGARRLARYGRRLKADSARLHHGWLVPPSETGRYGTNYLLRAYIASTVLGANTPAEATYVPSFVDRRGKPLSGAHRYILHFAAGQLPPVRAFWSLTLYGNDEFLVPNPISRYAIGDRTAGVRRSRDGSLDIRIQHGGPRQGHSNWLPAPTGQFFLVLRLYQPKPSVLRDRWPLPTITRVR